MAKKRKMKISNIILCILLIAVLIVLIVFGVRFILKDDSDDKENVEPTTPVVVDNNDTKIELNDYVVYEDKNNDLGFNFVVADLKFTNNETINYDLANLKTDEGVSLNSVSEYQQQLTMSGYTYALLNTSTDIVSSSNEFTAKVFIPYTKDSNSLTLTDLITNISIYIDLTNHKGDIDTIKKQDNSSELISNDYNISVANNYIASNVYYNGERYESSTLNVYVFEMTVNSVSNGVKITNATFKQTSTGETYECMDSSYTTSKSGITIENILDKTLKTNDKYALFFDVYGNLDDEPDYKGTITIEFSDNSSVTIDTELN